MKTSTFFALGCALGLCFSPSRADQLDDLITDMRNGTATSVDQNQRTEMLKATHEVASKSYQDGIVDLYLWEIKASIVDPDHNGGWPDHSFLVETSPDVRKNLTKALKERFDKKPYSLLAYALVCPALYVGDDKLVKEAESYLKAHDSFLYILERDQIDQSWRRHIKEILAQEMPEKEDD